MTTKRFKQLIVLQTTIVVAPQPFLVPLPALPFLIPTPLLPETLVWVETFNNRDIVSMHA